MKFGRNIKNGLK